MKCSSISPLPKFPQSSLGWVSSSSYTILFNKAATSQMQPFRNPVPMLYKPHFKCSLKPHMARGYHFGQHSYNHSEHCRKFYWTGAAVVDSSGRAHVYSYLGKNSEKTFFIAFTTWTSWWNVKSLVCIFSLYFLKTAPHCPAVEKSDNYLVLFPL